jgi:Domain of unknown function (DUF4386)
MRIAVWVGIAAAAVQVIGLLRWPILVPGYASDAASGDPTVAAGGRDSFTTASDILGYILWSVWLIAFGVLILRVGERWLPRARPQAQPRRRRREARAELARFGAARTQAA